MKRLWTKINGFLSYIDKADLSFLGVVICLIILAPVLYLGKGATFPIHDQLDEIILNYIFTAKNFGESVYPQMMSGLSAQAMKPSAYLFVPLYAFLDPYAAFVIQYFAVINVAFYGVYLLTRKLTGSSISAVLSGAVFALLPFRSIYGTSLCGFPMVVYLFMLLMEKTEDPGRDLKKRDRIKTFICFAGLALMALSSNLVLNGYASIIFMGVWILIKTCRDKRINFRPWVGMFIYGFTYLIQNLDLIRSFFVGSDVVSHRAEFDLGLSPGSFFGFFKEILIYGVEHNDSLHRYIYIPVAAALLCLIFLKDAREKYLKAFSGAVIALLTNVTLYSFFASGFFDRLQRNFGSLDSFQFDRFFYLVPGCFYVLLGVSLAIVINSIKGRITVAGVFVAFLLYLPTLMYVAKDGSGIFYMNINRINNGDLTGYITWESLYAENVMDRIERDIASDREANGLSGDMSEYKVVSIGICPVVSLMHGFYTIDGYSNNYSLEYKHKFGEIQEKELALNEYNASYFYGWGSRCYLFYHEWGNGFYLGKDLNLTIDDMQFDMDKMYDMGVRYIFSAGKVTDPEKYGLEYLGSYTDKVSFWNINVYKIG
ncbi:MAG: DUF6044 family protein [Acetatifactor sp.]|nr:DUF6044 family protein [Acetatifactor sp.]